MDKMEGDPSGVELHGWVSKGNGFRPPAANLHILHVFT